MANVRGFLQKAFPFISLGLSFAGPVGNAAAQALGTAIGKPDLKLDGVDAALQNIQLTPDQIVLLKQAEQGFQQTMAQLGYQDKESMASIAAQDTASARNREIQTKDWYPRILATITVALCFAGEFLYFRYGAPNASPELTGRILGTLDSALILVLGYYFGSSKGSDDKNATILQLAQK